jgi:hypothetical protein
MDDQQTWAERLAREDRERQREDDQRRRQMAAVLGRDQRREARRLETEERARQREEAKRQRHEARIARLAERKRLAASAARAALGWTASVWLETALWVCLGLSLLVAYTVSYSSLGTVLGAFGYGAWERWAAPLAIDLPLTASVVGQLLAARWGSPFHVKAILFLLSLATAPLTLAGNALHGAVDQWGHFAYDKNGALALGHVDLLHLVAFSIPGACVILVSLVASTMLTEREKLGRRSLVADAESEHHQIVPTSAGAPLDLDAGERQPDALHERFEQEPVSTTVPTVVRLE